MRKESKEGEAGKCSILLQERAKGLICPMRLAACYHRIAHKWMNKDEARTRSQELPFSCQPRMREKNDQLPYSVYLSLLQKLCITWIVPAIMPSSQEVYIQSERQQIHAT